MTGESDPEAGIAVFRCAREILDIPHREEPARVEHCENFARKLLGRA